MPPYSLRRRYLLRTIFAATAAAVLLAAGVIWLQTRALRFAIDELRHKSEHLAMAIAASRVLGSGFLLPSEDMQTPHEAMSVVGILVPAVPFDPSSPASRAAPIVMRIVAGSGARARLYDRRGELIVDTGARQADLPGPNFAARATVEVAGVVGRHSSGWTIVLCWIANSARRDITCLDGLEQSDHSSLSGVEQAQQRAMTAIAVAADRLVAIVKAGIYHRGRFEGIIVLSSSVDR